MQKVFLLVAFLAAASACNSNHAAPDDGVPGPVTFSLTIDGQTVTGTSAARFSYNRGMMAIDENNQPEFRFTLADIKDPDGKPTRTVLYQSPIKVGTHEVDCSGDDHFYGLEITFEDENSDQYCADKVTLNVTEVSDTRVKGNFSGKFTLIGRPRQKTINVNCTFDIPRVK